MAASAAAQPQAPELTLEGESAGRFEFARMPELVLIRGIAQIVQLGFYQLDPANPWPAGDVEGNAGWLSKHPTRLVDATTGAASRQRHRHLRRATGELGYAAPGRAM